MGFVSNSFWKTYLVVPNISVEWGMEIFSNCMLVKFAENKFVLTKNLCIEYAYHAVSVFGLGFYFSFWSILWPSKEKTILHIIDHS